MAIIQSQHWLEAAEQLKSGEVVAIPTETVYGLAARIDNDVSIKKIFQTKERPFFDPLIVHVDSLAMAKTLIADSHPVFEMLAQKYWPGPLTLVVRKNPQVVSDIITSGLPTVAIRCPQHPLALQLIGGVAIPLAAPSANKFSKTSPTKAEHVEKDFSGEVMVLDGGDCQVGLESTILQLDWDLELDITLLRPGMISYGEVQSFLGEQGVKAQFHESLSGEKAPGQQKEHYRPGQPLIFLKKPQAVNLQSVSQQLSQPLRALSQLELSPVPAIAARQLYSEFRRLSKVPESVIVFIQQPQHTGPEWQAVINRIERAASVILS